MENKLNQTALKEYTEKYSNLLLEKLFADKKSISGKEILDEIAVKQVGLFVLFNLFKAWKLEMKQLKSPYFNYEVEEVKLKLEELMNMLSKHISIKQDDFSPLLKKSVEDTLILIVSPLKYYEELVESYNGIAPSMDEVKDLQRFIKINSHMRDALLTSWASNIKEEELFNKAFEGMTEPPEEVHKLIEPFNELLAIELSTFWLEEDIDEPSDLIDDGEEEEAVFRTIHTQFEEENTTLLADSLGFESEKALLKTMLTINQKFMFTNDLFDGSKEDFNKVIDFLDTCETKEVVLKFLQTNYIQRGNWKIEAPQVKEFLALIDKRFD